MARVVRCGLIQAKTPLDGRQPLSAIKKAMIDKHLKMIEQAAKKKVQILCLQELFYGPYFCAEQNTALVRTDRARSRRTDHQAHAENRRQASHGHRGAGL